MATLVSATQFTNAQRQQDTTDNEWIPLLAGANVTTGDVTGKAIVQCERYFIKPYKIWLVCIGWDDYQESPSKLALTLRRMWAAIFFLILNCALVTQIITCFRRDQPLRVRVWTLNESVNNSDPGPSQAINCSTSVTSVFIIPDILLILTYIYGLISFSRGDSDYLHKLSGEVFVQCVTFTKWYEPTPAILIFTVWSFLVMAIVYTVTSLLVRIAYAFAFDLIKKEVIINWPGVMDIQDEWKIGLVIFSLVGFVFFDMVYSAAIINHAAQCELNIYFLHAVKHKVEERQYKTIEEAITNIGKAYNFIKALNGRTATLTGLILFNIASAALVGIISLSDNSDSVFQTTVETMSTLLWMVLVVFPYVQAARVTHACNELLATGPLIRRRPFLYRDVSVTDLDSYCQFTNSIVLRATMLGIPVYPWIVYLVAVCFTFTLLILWQTGAYWYSKWL